MTVFKALLAGGLCLCMVAAQAGEQPAYRQIHFQVERSQDVVNDRMLVRMQAEGEHKDPAQLARMINDTMEWALAQAGDTPGMRIATGNYQTYPVRTKEKLQGWRASQELRIEGDDMPAISALVGALQARLQVRSMGFSVSEERRREVEDALIDTALAAVQARASRIQKALGASAYTLVQANIQSGGHYPGPAPVLRAHMTSMEASAPAVDAGESKLAVTVAATIELAKR